MEQETKTLQEKVDMGVIPFYLVKYILNDYPDDV